MTSGVNGIGGNSVYGNGGYLPQRQETKTETEEQVVVNNYEDTQIDPDKVMEFMNQYVYSINPETKVDSVPELDEETQQRIASFMEQFEFFYGIICQEFGEELAPMVMDMVMDNLMAMK